ncbi:ATP-dependent DNA helicase srs2 [Cytospora mali]|uniref:DNA 3'-5' helicase n=1 Tax=Cytospora mali TaxID=578113 RepID=A0A194W0S4_CYTMA|nr:ATP-dependent DNA helicase srs2 [Valsa mali]
MTTSRYSSSILETLNEAQCRAVCSEAATVAIMAGPGSGKTHTVTSRVVWLVDTIGYQPQNVIVATFTVKAAREMRDRIGKALGDGREGKMILGTFHSIARRYLAAYGKHIGLNQKFAIADDGDSRAIINRICKRLQLSIDPVQARAWISKRKAKGKEWKPNPLQRKHSGEAAEGARSFEKCYREYQDQLERSNLLDYDDLLVRCVELLQSHPACVSNVEVVLIDEYQDTNGIQYELMRLLAQKRNRITIVGDPDQSIYGWRSAEIRNLQRLFEDFPRTDQVALEKNYRSSQSILDTALNVIQQDSKRYRKVLKPIHDKGIRPTLRRLKTSGDEAQWIVKEIGRLQLMSGQMLGHQDVAILIRSAFLSRNIESALVQAEIAYKMVGGLKFYERAEIKVLLDYLRVVHQPENNDALARILNVPKRGVGEVTIKALVEEAERSRLSLWALLVKHCRGDRTAKTSITKTAEQKISGEVIRLILDIRKKMVNPLDEMPYGVVEVIDEVIAKVGLEKYLQDTYREREDHEQRWANVQEFRTLGDDFAKDLASDTDEVLPEIDGLEQLKDSDVLARFLANISLASDVQKQNESQQSTPMVTISTIHAAKGLEWPIVFIPAAYNGSIPHMRSEDDDEERRLLYVAMTRAMVLLYISCPLFSSSYGGGQSEVELSKFVEPVAKSFGKIGPNLEEHRLGTIGKILGRLVPTQEAIYDGLPKDFSPNDDLFPDEPRTNQTAADSGSAWEELPSEKLRRKRPRLAGPNGSLECDKEPQWAKGYSTTMEQTSTFTMASQPGFVSAGAHQAALLSTRSSGNTISGPPFKEGKTMRPAGQSTLLGFVKQDTKSVTEESESGASRASLHRSISTSLHSGSHGQGSVLSTSLGALRRPAINPELLHHKITASKPVTHKPSLPKEVANSLKQYTHFSSSPPRPPTPEDATEAIDEETSNENTTVSTPVAAKRPAVSLHKTTLQKTSVRRPPGLAAPRDKAAALQKLRKPFRPLTMNRT